MPLPEVFVVLRDIWRLVLCHHFGLYCDGAVISKLEAEHAAYAARGMEKRD